MWQKLKQKISVKTITLCQNFNLCWESIPGPQSPYTSTLSLCQHSLNSIDKIYLSEMILLRVWTPIVCPATELFRATFDLWVFCPAWRKAIVLIAFGRKLWRISLIWPSASFESLRWGPVTLFRLAFHLRPLFWSSHWITFTAFFPLYLSPLASSCKISSCPLQSRTSTCLYECKQPRGLAKNSELRSPGA